MDLIHLLLAINLNVRLPISQLISKSSAFSLQVEQRGPLTPGHEPPGRIQSEVTWQHSNVLLEAPGRRLPWLPTGAALELLLG